MPLNPLGQLCYTQIFELQSIHYTYIWPRSFLFELGIRVDLEPPISYIVYRNSTCALYVFCIQYLRYVCGFLHRASNSFSSGPTWYLTWSNLRRCKALFSEGNKELNHTPLPSVRTR
jgi:hypothetical protein